MLRESHGAAWQTNHILLGKQAFQRAQHHTVRGSSTLLANAVVFPFQKSGLGSSMAGVAGIISLIVRSKAGGWNNDGKQMVLIDPSI